MRAITIRPLLRKTSPCRTVMVTSRLITAGGLRNRIPTADTTTTTISRKTKNNHELCLRSFHSLYARSVSMPFSGMLSSFRL
jgi:hypothetical protein